MEELPLEDSMSVQEDDLDLVQKWGLYFLLRSTHADENYMRVLLDWLENKVAVMNFGRIWQESGNMRYYHLPLSDLVDNDDAILLVKILNIEHQGASRGLLNHFDLVCGQNPVEFLQDLAPATDRIDAGRVIIDPTSVSTDILCSAQVIQDQKVQKVEQALQSTELRLRTLSSVQASLTNSEQEPASSPSAQLTNWENVVSVLKLGTRASMPEAESGLSESIPKLTHTQAAERLLPFDRSTTFGPSSSLTRRERWNRGRDLKVDTRQWEWVDAVLIKFPDLANQKAGQQPALPVSGVRRATLVSSNARPWRALPARTAQHGTVT